MISTEGFLVSEAASLMSLRSGDGFPVLSRAMQ